MLRELRSLTDYPDSTGTVKVLGNYNTKKRKVAVLIVIFSNFYDYIWSMNGQFKMNLWITEVNTVFTENIAMSQGALVR